MLPKEELKGDAAKTTIVLTRLERFFIVFPENAIIAGDMMQKDCLKINMDMYFSSFDLRLGGFMSSLAPEENAQAVQLASALVSRQMREGHVCVHLNEFAGGSLPSAGVQEEQARFPELPVWLRALKNTACVGAPGDFQPMILDNANRLYFQRYWQYEQDIAGFILSRLPIVQDVEIPLPVIREKLHRYFPEMISGKIFWPGIAAAAALMRKFFVITGSPGTGKTTTITKIMAFLLDAGNDQLRIALCAPTGKAATRLEQSVKKAKEHVVCPEAIKNRIPEEAMTIHRLLGVIRHSPYFRFNEKNTLPYDLVVIDEASMVDLPLMAKLMTALAPDARLILLGDKDQLASVEAGAVLGSICHPERLNVFSGSFGRRLEEICGAKIESSDAPAGAQDCIIELKHNYRFSENSGIGLLSKAINQGDSLRVLELIEAEKLPDVRFSEIYRSGEIPGFLRENVLKHYGRYLHAVASVPVCAEAVFERFEAFRVLCAFRVGFWGTQRINAVIERLLAEAGLIDPSLPYYEGRPVMMAQNDYRLQLFNGDIGIVLRDAAGDNKLRVFFRDSRQGFRKFAPERLALHETAWAMTVHKSQGSEFDHVALILSDNDAPVLTKELLYTGITRARYFVNIWSGKSVIIKTIQKQIIRQSGLTDAIQCPAAVS